APLDDYRGLLRGRALIALGKKELAYRELDAIKAPAMRCGKTALPHALFVDALISKAELLGETEPSAAAELLLSLPSAGDTLAQAVELYRRGGDSAQAEAIEARLLVEVPDAPEARALAKTLGQKGIASRLSSEQRLLRVRNLLETHQNLEARL